VAERFTIVYPGKPVGKGRPRFNKATGHVRTPQKTKDWEEGFSWKAVVAAKRAGWDLSYGGPVGVDVVAVFDRPQRHREYARAWRQGTPDGDNVLKAVADALQKAGIVKNDTQIVDWRVRCVYGAEGETAHLEVCVYRAEEVTCAV